MSETPPQSAAGTGLPADALPLPEAVQRFVPNDLRQAYSAAIKDRARFPGRIVSYSPYLYGDDAAGKNRTANQARAASTAKGKAGAAIKRAFVAMLIEGALTAHVRREFPFGDWDALPPDAWRTLRITNWRRGVIEGAGIRFVDVRISRTPDSRREPLQQGQAPVAEPPVQEPSSSQPVGPTLPSRELRLTIDDRRSKIIIWDMGELTGSNSRLIALLAETAREDIKAEKAPEEHQYIKGHKLANRLELTRTSFYRRVSECRKAVAAMAAEPFGEAASKDLLIENSHWHGYRLNPHIRFVAPKD